MLSRIAESMFWIGRYVERAEDTARLLQTHLRLLVEDTSSEVDSCRNLLALMNADHVEDPTLADLLKVLGYDAREPTSIYSAWAAARDNARRAREVIPLDLWESINATWHQLPREPFGVAGAHTFLNWARERSALFTGIARGIMLPGRRLAVHVDGPLARAGGHDLADGGLRLADRRQHPVAGRAARLRRTRRVPADLPGPAQ